MHIRVYRSMMMILIIQVVLPCYLCFSENSQLVEFFDCGGKYGVRRKTTHETLIQPSFESYGEWFKDASIEDGFYDYKGLSEHEIEISYAKIWNQGRCGLIDSEGKLLIRPEWDEIDEVSSCYAIVVLNEQRGIYNINSNNVIAYPEWEQIIYIRDDNTFYVTKEKEDGYYEGTLNADGSVGIPAVFEQIERVKEGLSFYKEGSLWGIISANGNVITEPQFERRISSLFFSEGLAAVFINERAGYVDSAGRIVIPAKYGFGRPFKDGYAIVTDLTLSLYGMVDKLGNEVVPLVWQSINYNDETGYILTDNNGKQVNIYSIQALIDIM